MLLYEYPEGEQHREKNMKELATLLGFALLAKNALATSTILAKPPTGDDELDDLEVQRIVKKNKRVRKAASKRAGKLLVNAHTSDETPKYTKEEWQKGQLLGVLEIDDPERETDLGTGVFTLMARLSTDAETKEEKITVFYYNEKTKKMVATAIGMRHGEKMTGRETVRLDIRDETEGEKGKGDNCFAPRRRAIYVKRVIKACWKIFGIEVICMERTEKVT
jgi:predicted ATP-dependent protease